MKAQNINIENKGGGTTHSSYIAISVTPQIVISSLCRIKPDKSISVKIQILREMSLKNFSKENRSNNCFSIISLNREVEG